MTVRKSLVIVDPILVTDAMILGTDVPENDYPAYAAPTTYPLGDRVLIASTHLIYESVQAANIGHDPSTSPTWWKLVGYSNCRRMFDGKIGSTTAQANSFYYRIKPGVAITAVSALNITGAASLRFRLIDPVYGTVYDNTQDVGPTPRSADPWEWAFGVWTSGRRKVVLLDLPAFPNAELRIDAVGGADLAIGTLLIGQGVEFGIGVKYGLRLSMKDYSQKAVDTWGNVDVVPGEFSDTSGFELSLRNEEIDSLKDYVVTLRSKKVLFVISDQWTASMIYGFFLKFEIVVPYPVASDCAMDIEGVT